MTLKPTFTLTIGEQVSNSDQPAFGPRSFHVERDMDVPADSLRIDLFERPDIELGTPVSLELGHDGENEQVFTGKVSLMRPTLSGVAVLALGSMDGLLNLRTAVTYESQSIGSIARDLVDQAGLETGTVDNGPTLPRFAVDRRLSAYAHLRDLAERLGFELYCDRDGKVMFHGLGGAASLDAAGGALGAAVSAVSSALGLGGAEGYLFGQHLIQANTWRRAPAWNSVDVGGESPMSSQGESTAHWLTVNDSDYRGSAGSGDPAGLLIDGAARSKDLANRFAAGRLFTAQRSAHQVSFTVLGNPGVELGDDLSVSEVPDSIVNGQGYVRAIRHQFSDRTGFVTEFRISLPAGEGA